MPDLALGIVEPREAVAAFERRGQLEPSFRWQDVWAEEHARAFAVAGVQRLDVLQVFQEELGAALSDGRSLADFRKAITPRLTAKGWWGDIEIKDAATGETRVTTFDNRRLQLIFDVNLRQSYAAGQWAAIERNKGRQPYVMYVTMRDERVRASHRAWDGVVLPIDHPWWDTHTPMCGWRCRCRVVAMAEKDITRRQAAGLPVQRDAPAEQFIPYVNPGTGEIQAVARGVDPGFGYRKGRGVERDAALHEAALRKALASPPLAAAMAVAQAQTSAPLLVSAASRRFRSFVDDVLDAGRPSASGRLALLGAVPPPAVRALASQGTALPAAVVGVTDVDVLRTLRADGAVSAEVYRRLPELLSKATALVQDPSTGSALYWVIDLMGADGAGTTLLARADVPAAGRPSPLLLRSLQAVDAQTLRTRYRLVWGRL